MDLLLWLLALLLVIVGIAGVVLPAVPGAPLVFGGLLIMAWLGDFQRVGWVTLVTLGGLTAFSYVVDFMAVNAGAKRFGASRKAAWGGAIGLLVGLFFGIPGILVGPFVGAFVGEFVSMGSVGQAGRAGVGTWLGLAFGVVLKLALVFAMIGVFIIAYVVS